MLDGMMTIPGKATLEGTKRFAARFASAVPGHFRPAQGWTVSSLGLGTYAGDNDDMTDARYAAAIDRAVELSCNVIDTAVAYRNQRSERVIGQQLAGLIAEGKIQRDEVVIATKAGFIPFDSAYRGGVDQYFKEVFIKPGIVTPDDVGPSRHCLAPKFLWHQIETSQRNLKCATIDIYYLHNPETQLREVDRKEFYRRMRAAFEVLECAVAEGKIGMYGTSTWSGYRVIPGVEEYLSLADLVRLATEVGGQHHHLRAVMLPLNLAMLEGFALYNQCVEGKDEPISLLQAAQDFDITVLAGSPLHLGRLTQNLPDEVRAVLNGELATDAQRALQFTRSLPGLTTALIGMGNLVHVEENLMLANVPPVMEERLLQLFEECH